MALVKMLARRTYSNMQNECREVQVYYGGTNQLISTTVEADKNTPAIEIVSLVSARLKLPNPENFYLAEVFLSGGQICKSRPMDASENPIKTQLLWPRIIYHDDSNNLSAENRFYIYKKEPLAYPLSESNTEYPTEFFRTLKRQESVVKEYPDLCNLPDLNEQTLLDNLHRRFDNGDIYTYIGTILIAINPFKFYPIYNPKYVKMYHSKNYSDLPPHIFAIASAAFFGMMNSKQNQCIMISGESGSGKTESTNLLLHHLTALSQKGLYAGGIEQTVLGAGPVLEAFGNAVTVHNSNSSRFGKFIQINFKENGILHGAVVEKYLLEKSRIVSQNSSERNYHVFYYLLTGADANLKQRLRLKQAIDYAYLQHEEIKVEADEHHEFLRLRQSMELVGFSNSLQRNIFSILSAVLHIGNIQFKKKEYKFDESVSFCCAELLSVISDLLHVQEETLIDALTQKRAIAGDETVIITYKMEDAVAARDAMAKCLYGALFDWIVLKVNQALHAKQNFSEHKGNSIGILDIFGFENFAHNSFEQFCINFANERLQYYFNQHVFKIEQEEYSREGIDWENIDFIDNTGCLELFTKRTVGLFSLLDEECNLPGASSDRLLSRFNKSLKHNFYYSQPQMRETAFIVEHYAGSIKYEITAFREKNTDLVRPEIVHVLKKSSLTFIRELVASDMVAFKRWGVLRVMFSAMFAFIKAGLSRKSHRDKESAFDDYIHTRERQPAKPRNSFPEDLLEIDVKIVQYFSKLISRRPSSREKPNCVNRINDRKILKTLKRKRSSTGNIRQGKIGSSTVAAQFQTSLNHLMETLNEANPFFVRCIKSNSSMSPRVFDKDLVMTQLRYTGMLATVKIRQCGYNHRFTFKAFIHLYGLLLPNGRESKEDDIRTFLESMNFYGLQIGTSKVFLREMEKTLLDRKLHNMLIERIIKLQRWMKSIIQRRQFLQICSSALIIQTAIRRFLAINQRRKELSAILIQKWCRRYFAQKASLIRLMYIIIIQTSVRSWLARRRYAAMLREKELTDKVKAKHGEVRDEIQLISEKIQRASITRKPVSGVFKPTHENGSLMDNEAENLSNTSPQSQNHLTEECPGHKRRPVTRRGHVVIPRTKVHRVVPPSPHVARTVSSESEESDLPSEDTSISSPEIPRHTLEPIDITIPIPKSEGRKLLKIKMHIKGIMGKKGKPNEKSFIQSSQESPGHHVERIPVDGFRPNTKKHSNNSKRNRGGNWILAGMSEWQYPKDCIIQNSAALYAFDDFISKRFKGYCKRENKNNTIYDKVFKKSLTDFHLEIKTRSAIAAKQQTLSIKIQYRELMVMFENILQRCAKDEKVSNSFPAPMGINAFRGYLDEFTKRDIKDDRKAEKRRHKNKGTRYTEHLGHRYNEVTYNSIHLVCEHCSIQIGVVEKVFICQVCNYTIHESCCWQSKQPCKGYGNVSPVFEDDNQHKIFGKPLSSLLTSFENVPGFFENLINAIETKGLDTEGLYRKSGSIIKINQLKSALEEDTSKVDFNEYQVQTLTSVLKDFIRDLPEPILTNELDQDFLRCLEADTTKDRLAAINGVIQQIPPPNSMFFERLIIHLVKVADNEEYNKMNSCSLAMIFAPSFFRKSETAQEELCKLPRQTQCIEYMIADRLQIWRMNRSKYAALESASSRLIRMKDVLRSKRKIQGAYDGQAIHYLSTDDDNLSYTSDINDPELASTSDSEAHRESLAEEKILTETIKQIQLQKEELTNDLPFMRSDTVGSDDDIINSDDQLSLMDMLDKQYGVDDNEDLAVSFDIPVIPRELRHLTKNRVKSFPKRLPERHRYSLFDNPAVGSQSLDRNPRSRISGHLEIMV